MSKHHWSYSKSMDYDACPLKIYFRTSQNGNPSKASDYSSQPINLSAVVGIAVHRGISSQIDEWVDGDTPTYEGAKQEAEKCIEDIWENRHERIVEIVNGGRVLDGQQTKFSGLTKRHLRTFFKAIWPEFRNHEYIFHEELRKFTVKGNKVFIKVDLCTRDQNDNLVITDWKTSKPPLLESDSLQLDVYGLWARERFKENVNDIKVQLGFTRTGKTNIHSPEPQKLNEAAIRIGRECREWNNKDGFDEFTADPKPQKCKGCQFLNQCEAGQSTLER